MFKETCKYSVKMRIRHYSVLWYVCMLALLSSAPFSIAADGIWTNMAGGSWTNAGNWSVGIVAAGLDSQADFSSLDIPSNAVVTLDSPVTIGHLKFADISSGQNWTLNPGIGGILTLSASSNIPSIYVTNTTLTIECPIAGTNGFKKDGPGTLVLTAGNSYFGPTIVSNGVMKLSPVCTLGASSNLDVFPNAQIIVMSSPSNTIADNAVINLRSGAGYGQIYLTNTVNETVGALSFNFVGQSNGTWGATGSGCVHTNDNYFAGAGILTVLNGSTGGVSVVNQPASGVTSSSAVLGGSLVSGGGTNMAWLRIYWGLADGGTNKLSWSDLADLGPAGVGPFATNVMGFLSNTQYFYRCYASNTFGTAWAPGTTNFMTSPVAGANGSWNVDADGNWSAAGNWAGSIVATGSSQTAFFMNAITADRAVNVDSSPWTIGSLIFDSPSPYNWTITGGPVVVSVATGMASISVLTNVATFYSSISGSNGLNVNGMGQLMLCASNSYFGQTVVGGSLIITGNGSIRNSTTINVLPGALVSVLNPSADAIADNAVLYLIYSNFYGNVNLGNTVNETVGALYFDGVPQAAGTWGATGSGAANVNDNFFSGMGMINVLNAGPTTRFVTISGSHTPPYTSWATAATNIQAAIDSCSAGDIVRVTNGVYNITSQIVISNGITLSSMSGAAATVIDAGLTSRCLFVNNPGAVVEGFTLTHGRTFAFSDYGGGLLLSNGIVRRCSITFNEAFDTGGGVSCASNGILESCLIVSNDTHYGGGVYLGGGYMRNCTVVDNVATSSGGGGIVIDMGGQVWNSIVYSNQGGLLGTNICLNSGQVVYTCVTPDPGGSNNITVDPIFTGTGNYRLQVGSACIDSGANQVWMPSASDLDGNSRVLNAVVDRGCYEYSGGASGPVGIINQAASDITPNSAILNATVTGNGGGTWPYVTMYWGTVDGGSNSAAWANTNSLGMRDVGPVSNSIGGLAPNTLYHFSSYASNSVGTAWAPASQTFNTPPSGGGQDYLKITGLPSYAFTNQVQTFTVEAWQGTNLWTNYTGTVHFSTSDTNSYIPSNYTFQVSNNGSHTFTNGLAYFVGAHHMLDVEDLSNSYITGYSPLIVFNGTATNAAYLDISDITDPLFTGQLTSVSVAAVDNFFNLVTNFTGQIDFTSSDGAAVLPWLGSSNWTYAVSDGGWHTFTNDLQFNTIGEHWFKAAWQSNTNITGTKYDITIQGPGAGTSATHLVISDVLHKAAQGLAMNVRLEARDALERIDTNFSGNVIFSSSDPAVTFAGGSNVLILAGDKGDKFLGNFLQFNTPGTQWLSAVWIGNTNVFGFVGNIIVSPAGGPPPVWLELEVIPKTEIALRNDPMSLKVTARTSGGLIDTNYSGTVEFLSSDGGATLPGPFVFLPGDQGVHIFGNALQFAGGGKQNAEVQESGKPETRQSVNFMVMAGGATNTTHFSLDACPTMLSNFWYNMTIVACGAGNLVDTNFNGNVLFSSTDPMGAFTFSNFNSFSNGIGRISSQVTMRAPGMQTIKATYMSDTNVFGNMNVMVLGGGNYYYVDNAFGSDSNNGLSTNLPFATITRGYVSAVAGDVIIVGGGNADYTNSITIAASGSPGRYIGLVGDADSIFFGRGNIPRIRTGPGAGIDTGAGSYLAFSGLQIADCSTGIVVAGGSNIAIVDCEINGCQNGVYANGVTALTLAGSSIQATTNIAVELNGSCHSAVITDNVIFDCYRGLLVLNSTNLTISANWLENASDVALIMNDTSSAEIEGNTIMNSGSIAISVASPAMNTAWAYIHRNIISGGGAWAIWLNEAASGVQIINNTIFQNVGGVDINNTANVLLKNNIISAQVSTGVRADTTNGLVAAYNDVFGSLTNWSGSSSPGTGCISIDPQFAGASDFHLRSVAGRPTPNGWVYDGINSPCIDAGDVGDDFSREPLPNGGRVDMGAYGNTYDAPLSPGPGLHDIMAIAPLNGSINPSGTVWVANGSNQIFSITPDPNYHIIDVTIDGTNNIGPTNSYTFISVTNNGHSISATFAPDTYTLTVTSPYGTPSPSGTTTSTWNTLLNAWVISPASNGISTQYVCTGWIGTGSVSAVGFSNSVTFNITADSAITWQWQTNYLLSAAADSNGSVDITGGWVTAGGGPTINATPNAGYHFVNWTGDMASTNNPLTLSMSNAASITANFAINTYGITASSLGNGDILPTGTVFVAHNGSSNFTLSAYPGYHINDVIVDAVSQGPTNSFTFLNVTNSHTIVASFAVNQYPLTVSSAYGSPSPAGTTTNNWSTFITASVAGSPLNNGTTQFICTGWTGSGDVTPGAGTNTSFTQMSASTLTWLWATNYWLNPTGTVGGAVSMGPGWQPAGTNISITATPTNGYSFTGWTGGITSTNNPLNLTMTNAFALTANFTAVLGSVTVYISPTNAQAMGAQWRMTTGPDTAWHTNGFVISGVPGTGSPYTVTFNTIASYTPPPDMTNVVIINGATKTNTGIYMIGSMVLIPGGTFTMGIYQGSGGHQVTLSDYFVDTRKVTVGEFQAFIAATAGTMPAAPAWGWTNTNLPVVNVSWNLASAYATWVGKRLLTEAEYEYVMRSGVSDRLYPWGNTISSANANYFSAIGLPTVAGAYPVNAYGVYDISGNAWEWCSDWYGSSLTGPVTNPTGPGTGSTKVVRGGSWASSAFTLQCAPRYNNAPATGYVDLGFRCAVTAPVGGGGGGFKVADANNNGIPDWWEQYYFGLAISGAGKGGGFDANADPDTDGAVNLNEYLAGTDPTNSASVFQLRELVSSPGPDMTIEWSSAPGKRYTIERSGTLTQGFNPFVTNVTATPPLNTFTDTTGNGESYFYRIKLE